MTTRIALVAETPTCDSAKPTRWLGEIETSSAFAKHSRASTVSESAFGAECTAIPWSGAPNLKCFGRLASGSPILWSGARQRRRDRAARFHGPSLRRQTLVCGAASEWPLGATHARVACMLLLNISDIHFSSPACLNADTDPDRPYRTRLVQDVRNRCQTLGPVGAILVGGDIAFKADPAEYDVALAWLRELAGACGCSMERVFVVPGNHDVDRAKIRGDVAIRNVQRAIAQAGLHEREHELRAQLDHADTARALFIPLAAYNQFASRFSCQVFAPDRLYWRQDLPLQDLSIEEGGVQLRIFGLTSVLLSGALRGANQDDARESLYLSPLQTVLDPVDDVVNLVLCHHPPDWFLDMDDVDDAICGKSVVHLFGHKHRQRIIRDVDYLRLPAGAVNPDRREVGWLPGYNLIDLRIDGKGEDRVLKIEAHMLQWQSNPDMYRAVQTRQRQEVFRHHVAIPGRPAAASTHKADADSRDSSRESPPSREEAAEADVEPTMSDPTTRNLVFRFWNLTVSDRREISLKLGLIEESEIPLPEPERYGRALLRAGERGILPELAKEVAAREGG